MTRSTPHPWTLRPRFRRHAFGWRSQPAIQRIQETVSEIKRVARTNPMLAAEGAVCFLERLSPAIEQVDSSSGAIGNAVNRAIDTLAALIGTASADEPSRERWLERLWAAYQDDGIPYLEPLGHHWGTLCAAPAIASPYAPQTLIRAARDFTESQPEFAREAGLAALRWIIAGYGYEITTSDVLAACKHTLAAAEQADCAAATRQRIRELLDAQGAGAGFVAAVLGRELGLSR